MSGKPDQTDGDDGQGRQEGRRGLLYVLMAPLAMLGLVSATVSHRDARKYPKARLLGILIVPLVLAAVAFYMWADNQGYVRDARSALGLSGTYYDVATGNVCTDLGRGYDSSEGRAQAYLEFHDDGRTVLGVDQIDGAYAQSLSLVFQADPNADLDDDIVAAVQVAFLRWFVTESDLAQGGLTDESNWVGPTPPLNEIAQIRAEDMGQHDLTGVDLRIGNIEINRGDTWLTVPVVLWRDGAVGDRAYEIYGRVPEAEMADAILVFSSAEAGDATLRLSRGDQWRRVATHRLPAADMGAVMRAAIDDMLALWQTGLPGSC